MIESSKYNRENYPRKCFWTQQRETGVKFNPGLTFEQLGPGDETGLTIFISKNKSGGNFPEIFVSRQGS